MSSGHEYQHGWQRLLNSAQRLVRGATSWLFNLLPSAPGSDDEYVPGLSNEEVSERRRLRLKIKMLAKDGKGGPR